MITEAEPTPSTRTRAQTFSALTYVFGTPDLNIQILGLTSGKNSGAPMVASMQNTAAAAGDWTPSLIPLSGAPSSMPLVDLTACAGSLATEVVGLGNDGNIYVVGTQTTTNTWAPGSGLVTQTGGVTFQPGSLTSHLLNTTTVFAVTSTNLPWVATYRDQHQTWQPGYALPLPVIAAFNWIGARPDWSDAGTTHAIGLTKDGRACEVATAAGPGTGVSNWTMGSGYLGSTSGLPAFKQLVLVTADNAKNFHVIGFGQDGSVWDIDQFSATAATWSGVSASIVPAKTVESKTIDFYLSTVSAQICINLVAQTQSGFQTFATYGSSWAQASTPIPTSGTPVSWHIVNNLMNDSEAGAFILGLTGSGLACEPSYFDGTTWHAGLSGIISG